MANFRHQLFLLGKNTEHALGHVSGWLLMLAVAAACLGRVARRQPPGEKRSLLDARERRVVLLAALTAGLFVFGYALLQVQDRYVVPVLAPMLCIIALSCFCAARRGRHSLQPDLAARAGMDGHSLKTGLRHSWLRGAFFPGLLLVAPFSFQDFNRLRDSMFKHSQMGSLSKTRALAEQLRHEDFLGRRFACSYWHFGLGIAYVADLLPVYMGCPLALEPDARAAELQSAGVGVYLQLLAQGQANLPPTLGAPWQLAKNIPLEKGVSLQVYTIPKSASDRPAAPKGGRPRSPFRPLPARAYAALDSE